MEKTHTYAASLCWHGLLGGGLILDDERVTYRTGKITVPPEIRNLALPFCRIQSVELSKILFLPAVTFRMEDGSEWKFLVFRRGSFLGNRKTAMDAYASGD